MKRTTIFLPEATLSQIQRVAQRKNVSAAMLIREAVTRYLSAPEGVAGVPSISGRFASGTSDTSERADELLWKDPHA